jgi:peptide/nickel transport system permease protein
MCIPSLPLAIILAAYLNASIINLIIAISITAWTGTLRIVRSRVFQLRELPFIKIEQALGVRGWLILFKHILPNVLDIVLMRSALSVAGAMLTEAGLSFLGLGVYKQKSWGGILHYAFFRNGVVNGYWWWILPPIIMISLTVLGFVLVGYYGGTTRAYASSMSTAGGQSSA